MNAEPPLKIIVSGPLKGSYSLAVVNRAFARALEANGQRVILHSSEDREELEADEDFQGMGALASTLISDLSDASDADLVTINTWPIIDAPAKIPAVMHCFGWEESIISFPLASLMSGYRMIGTMSSFVSRAFQNSAVSVPVATLSLGTDHIPKLPAPNTLQATSSRRPFTFLHISSCFPRKGIDVLVDAYFSEFKSTDNVRLLVKTFPNPHNGGLAELIQRHRSRTKSPPSLTLVSSDLPPDKYFKLYADSDCLVAPSFGEGFLLPAAEATYRNCSVITTDWGGQTDFCNDDTAWMLRYALEPSRSHLAATGAQWAKPEKAHLQQLMRGMLRLPTEKRLNKMLAARKLLDEQFTWANVAKRFIDEIQSRDILKAGPNYRSNQKQRTRSVVVSTFGQHCGIATFAQELVGAAKERYEISGIVSEDVHASEMTLGDDHKHPPIYRDWRRDVKYVRQIVARLSTLRCNHVLVQHHPAIFGWEMLAELVKAVSSKYRVTIQLHSVLAGIDDFRRWSKVLEGADRIIVHSANEYLFACQILGSAKISLIPLGAGSIAAKPQRRSSFLGTHVVSFGFMGPHKGFHRIIEACAILRASGVDLRYTVLSALDLRRSDAVQYAKYCVELAKTLSLGENIEFDFSYGEMDDVIKRAAKCDVAVLAYDDVPEGASAASRVLMRAGIPLLVSDIPMFQDLKDVCIVSPQNSPYYFARKIAGITSSSEAWNLQAERQHRYLMATQWSRIADMIFGSLDDY